MSTTTVTPKLAAARQALAAALFLQQIECDREPYDGLAHDIAIDACNDAYERWELASDGDVRYSDSEWLDHITDPATLRDADADLRAALGEYLPIANDDHCDHREYSRVQEQLRVARGRLAALVGEDAAYVRQRVLIGW